MWPDVIQENNLISDYPIVELSSLDSIPKSQISETDGTILRCNKIKIKPTHKQRVILKKWIHLYRLVYNLTVKYLRLNKENISFYSLRKIIKSRFSPELNKKIKNSKIPSHTLDNAISDILKAIKTAKTLLRKGLIKYFRMRYKKRSKPKQTLTLEASAFSKNYPTFCIRALGKIIPGFRKFKNKTRDSRLQYDCRSGEFWLFMPEEKTIKRVQQKSEVCALDPGLRTFQTGYDKTKCFELDIPTTKIMKIKNEITRKQNQRHKKWYSKFERRRYDKIKHIVDDNHWKIANLLVKNYETILIGKLSTKSIVSKAGNLSKYNKNLAMILSHYTFRQRLITKAEEYQSTVVEVDEYLTTKTCGSCGVRNDPKKSKQYDCNSCGFTWGRDFNAARNIMIKTLE